LFGIVLTKEENTEIDDDFIKEELKHRINQAGAALESATIHYFIGIRGFFLSLCIGAWIFHAIACLIVTVFVVIFMYFSDHAFAPTHFHLSKEERARQQ